MAVVKVVVSQAYIEDGEPMSADACPIALALENLLPGAYEVNVSPVYVVIDYFVRVEGSPLYRPEQATIQLPVEAARFISVFDTDEVRPAPIEFDLEVPDEVLLRVE